MIIRPFVFDVQNNSDVILIHHSVALVSDVAQQQPFFLSCRPPDCRKRGKHTVISHFSSSSHQRKARERSSSESSWMERDEGADTPDSLHTLTGSLGAKNHCNQDSSHRYPPAEDKIKLPLFSQSSRRMPVPSINGEIGSEDKTL